MRTSKRRQGYLQNSLLLIKTKLLRNTNELLKRFSNVKLINTYNSSSTFDPYLLNFGNNIQEVVTNIVLNKIDTGYEILFKLYNELDPTIVEKSSLWALDRISFSEYIKKITEEEC